VHARGPLGALAPIVARAAVVTVPLGVLRARAGEPGHLRFRPTLPSAKRSAIDGLAMGAVMKLVLRFRALPPPLDRDDVVFVHAPRAPMPTWWKLTPIDAPVLVGWAGGPAADALARLAPEAALRRAIDALARAVRVPDLGERVAAQRTFDWRHDPFARGAYAWVPAGAEGAPATLAEPVDETLFFAGEATNLPEIGTVHGALRSGERAARELLRTR
jgi:monoamine oxidase